MSVAVQNHYSTSASFLSSVSQYIHLLREQDRQVQGAALERLSQVVDQNWAEIAEHLSLIEELLDDNDFPKRELASYVASKIYYHLEVYEDALNYALKSGHYFNLDERSQYVQCLVTTCIKHYVESKQRLYDQRAASAAASDSAMEQDRSGAAQQQANDDDEDVPQLNPQYKVVVEKMYKRSLEQGEYKLVLGTSVESREIEKVSEILTIDRQLNPASTELLSYLFNIATQQVLSFHFRQQLIQLIANFYVSKQKDARDYSNLGLCYFFLGWHKQLAQLLHELLFSPDHSIVALQIAMDVSENDSQFFVDNVEKSFPVEQDAQRTLKVKQLIAILQGKVRQQLYREFLKHNDHSDIQVMTKIKNEIGVRKQVTHSAGVFAYSLFNSGTGNDEFLSKNQDWFKKAESWNRFATAASVGVLQKGKWDESMELLKHYLQHAGDGQQGAAGGAQAPAQAFAAGSDQAGALFALGLINVGNNKNHEVQDYLISQMEEITGVANAANDPVASAKQQQGIYGACLGLGLAGFASQDENLYARMNQTLERVETVPSEAAALGIGMIMAGSGNGEVVGKLVQFAKDSHDREKIQRAIGEALALIMFQQEDKADALIEQLLLNGEAVLRQGGVMVLGMAYAGTGNYAAIKRLLKFAVDDVSDDVRRSSTVSLALVLFRQYEQLPKYMKLLANSYNPHVRYGTAIALGLACAGTCYKEALELIEPLLDDTIEFVQQGALIGMALILQQANAKMEPRLEKLKKTIDELLKNPQKHILIKFGAILAAGLLEVGGRNQVVALASSHNFPKLQACAGALLFSQFWYWYPRIHFLSLALQPQCIIGVDAQLRIPKSFQFQCDCKPSQFEYVPHIKIEEKKDEGSKEQVQLSTTTKAKARAAVKKQGNDPLNPALIKPESIPRTLTKRQSSKLEVVRQSSKIKEPEQKMEVEQQAKEEKAQEPNSYTLSNPSRVLEKQRKYITFIENRYTPLLNDRKNGIVFLIDSKPDEPEEYLAEQKAAATTTENKKMEEEEELVPPEDFIFDENAQRK